MRIGQSLVGATLLALVASPAVVPAAAASSTDVVGGGRLGERGVVVTDASGAAPLPAVVAGGWLLADAGTGEVLAAKGAHRQLRPASTIKTLTAMTVLSSLDLDAEHEAAWAEAAADGGKVGIVPGAVYTVRDLLHGMLLPSGNDAAEALAAANGGRRATVAQMQATADRLGAADTTVRNPSGLDADGQVTSAYDLALIARAALADPAFAELTATISYDFPGRLVKAGKKRPTYKIYTQNRLLTHGYRGAVGGKTGFTTLAGRTFWGAATRDGRTLLVSLLKVGGPTEDSAKALLDWGFANADKVTPVGVLVEPGTEQAGARVAQQAAAGGVAAAAADPAAAAPSPWLPWLVVGLLLVAGAVALWWGRVHDAVREAPRGGSHSADPAPSADPDAGPAPVAAPVADPAPVPVAPPVLAPAPGADEAPVSADGATDLERAKPRPVSGGHVKVIGPPSRRD